MRKRSLAIFSAVYFLLLLPLLPRLSLWLDEILELKGIRDVPLHELPAYIASNAGAVPLGYVPQMLFVKMFGYSAASGRLASALFAALSCYVLGWLCLRLRIRYPLLVMAIFALCPIQLRYATEARTYAQAICLTLLCTVAFTYMVEKPTPLRCIAWGGCIVAGLYTQPYTVFVPLAHCAWLVLERRRLLPLCGAIVFASAICFLPWYLYASHFWRVNVTHEGIRFVFRPHEIALIAHEITGAGYIGTALIVIACGAGLSPRALAVREKWFWSLLLIVPLAGPLAADAYFGYFVASRQFIFILPSLAVLSAVGITALHKQSATLSAAILLALWGAWITGDIGWFTKQREDWQAPASALIRHIHAGTCAQFIPANSRVYYAFFEPRLTDLTCEATESASSVWLAVSPYDAEPEYQRTLERLRKEGFARGTPVSSEHPHLERFERPAAK